MTQPNELLQLFGNSGGGGGSAMGAGLGGLLIGALLGNGGLFGNRGNGNGEPAVTPDQLQASINGLQGQISTDAVQAALAQLGISVSNVGGDVKEATGDLATALGCAISGVKDAVVSGQAQTNLALCGLGHNMQAGFASVNQTILMEAAKGRELTLSENLAQARVALATAHSDAKHTATQVMIQNLVKA